jgi:hypothetical protein
MRFAVLALLAACAPHAEPSSPPPTEVAARAGGDARVRQAPLAEGAHGGFDPSVGSVGSVGPVGSAGAAQVPAAPAPLGASPSPGAPPDPASCVDDGAPFEGAALRARAAYLASAELDGRAPGSPGDAATRAYLADRFRCLGLVPAGPSASYEQPFAADGHATANLVGYLPGDDAAVGSDIILVGAHHDHLGDGHLGANDNASGVVALLAIAQAIRQHGAPHRTIAFALFGGEELGLLGSAYFAAHPPAALPLERIVYDVNLDMVGSYTSAGAVYAMGTFRGLPATAIVKALAAERPALHVGTGGRGVGSDHEAFCKAGVPYVFFWTPDKRCYHARCDTIDALDVIHLGEIAAFAGELVERLSGVPGDLAGSRTRRGCSGR